MSTRLPPTPSPTQAILRTPLGRVRGLGSAKEGTDHFWKQRITGIANIMLLTAAICILVSLIGADYATVKKTLQKPAVAILLLMLVLAGMMHMRLGMQTVIEDYVHSEGSKVILLMLNTFFTIGIGLTCVFAVFKLSFGA